ncbi:CvfB family protein [Bacillus litorisediminis]|uniref:CvfB family protein n=1 Tax=Bacillus litorisediminis TaxID=2922713 RepID=UPI001FAF6399|nr:S1 RNA-binding domain-containing protein [Bacillus litorisediminis]
MNRLEAGTVVRLQAEREAPFGYFLSDGDESVLLHQNEIDEKIELGQEVTVFLYHDKQGRLTATTKIPAIQKGRYGWAEVVDVVKKLGVFVNIGINKDILVSLDDLPLLEHLWPKEGDRLFLSLKSDRNGRLFGQLATEDIIRQMARKAPESMKNQNISGRVYRLLKVGSFVLTEDGYKGFIHESERIEEPRLGELVKGRVIGVKPDGSLNLSLIPRAHEKMDRDSEVILSFMESRNGAMPYTDKSQPDDIQLRFGMSKAAFKRALGRLMKADKVVQRNGWTYVVKNEPPEKQS